MSMFDREELSEADLMSLQQLYPDGCSAEEAADVLRVDEETVEEWRAAGGRSEAPPLAEWLVQIMAGNSTHNWQEEELG